MGWAPGSVRIAAPRISPWVGSWVILYLFPKSLKKSILVGHSLPISNRFSPFQERPTSAYLLVDSLEKSCPCGMLPRHPPTFGPLSGGYGEHCRA